MPREAELRGSYPVKSLGEALSLFFQKVAEALRKLAKALRKLVTNHKYWEALDAYYTANHIIERKSMPNSGLVVTARDHRRLSRAADRYLKQGGVVRVQSGGPWMEHEFF